MLNGKFYTGLPPKMMERNASAQNRLESHLFWPDDSKTESAVDTRLKRRTSFQAQQPTSRDETFHRQTSWSGVGGRNEVDTRQRFHKEFANSSIQFYDNIQEEEIDNAGRQAIRKPLIRRQLKQDVAIKPTAMNMKLPSTDTAQEEYAAIRKSQAFSSKINFYDNVDDNEKQKITKLRPKMDMNDKKDVERNTKNSPKLQVKGGVRNLQYPDTEQRSNDRKQSDDHITSERNYENYEEDEPQRHESRVLRNEIQVRGERRNNNDRIRGERDRYMGHHSPVRSYRNEYDDCYNDDMHDMPQQKYNERRAASRAQSVPKRILKNPIRDEGELEDQRGFYNDLEYVERNTRNMRIPTSPKKHVTYDDEIHEYEQHNGNQQNDNSNDYMRYDEGIESDRAARTATYGSRNEMNSKNRSIKGNNQRQQHNRPNTPDYEEQIITNDEEQSNSNNDRMVSSNISKKSLTFNNNTNNNYNNNHNNNKNSTKLNNLSQQQKQKRQQRKITPKISTSLIASTTNNESTATSPQSPTMDSQKHLRSSLCFSGGEIVANNCAEAGSGTPTTESSSRRTARSAATTRRVCVGLPD